MSSITKIPAAAIKVEPNSNGDVTITIELEIKTEGNVRVAVQGSTPVKSEALLSSDDSSDDDGDEVEVIGTKAPPKTSVKAPSFRSRVKIESESSDDEEEVDWALSQQLNTFNVEDV